MKKSILCVLALLCLNFSRSKMLILVIILCLSAVGAYGQVKVQGTVMAASDDEPLAGVNIMVAETTKGETTSANGTYSIEVSSGDVLVFSFIGFEPQQVYIYQDTLLNVSLVEDVEMLGEVMVYSTGYDQLPKERATGSFAQVDTELINRSVSTDIISRLEGVTSGLLFNSSNISDERISIRGRSTLLGGTATEPLIILDGFPYEGEIDNINPNIVESITVLKDAAAASIWGARSGNGVIVITTKKGLRDEPMRVEFISNITTAGKPDLRYNRNYLSSSDYIHVEKYLFDQGYYNGSINNTFFWPALTPVVEILEQERQGTISSAEANSLIDQYKKYDVRDDFEKYIYQQSLNQQYSLILSGGGKDVAYRFSVGYDNNRDNVIRNGYERLSLSALNTYYPIDKLEVTTGIDYTGSRLNTPNSFIFGSTTTFYRSSAGFYPYAQLADEQGNPLATVKDFRDVYKESFDGLKDWSYSPLEEIYLHERSTNINNLILRGGLKYDFTSYLSGSIKYQYQNQSSGSRNYSDPDSYEVRNLINRYAQADGEGGYDYIFPEGGILDLSEQVLKSQNIRIQINFDKNINNVHQVNALAGVEYRDLQSEGFSRTSYGYNDEFGTAVSNLDFQTRFPARPYGTATLPNSPTDVSGTTNRYISQYLNGAYTYDKRYTLTVSGRRDGANIFGAKTNDKFTPLWSVGGAWNVSNETFYAVEWLPDLKARLTYGYNGNVYNASSYLTARYGESTLTGLPYATILSPPNPLLRWERVRNINAGIDLALKGRRITGTIEYFIKDGQDLIEEISLAPSTGFQTYTGNGATTRTKGVDVILNSLNIDGAVKWQSNLLLSHIKDEVRSYDKEYTAQDIVSNLGNGTGALLAVEDRPLFGVYSYRWGGIDEEGDPLGFVGKEHNKDYLTLLNNATPDSLVFHGSARPTWFGGLRNTISWRGLSLSFNITYKLNYYFRRSSISLNYADLVNSSGHVDYHDRWQEPGDELTTDIPRPVYPNDNNRNNFYKYSEVLVERGDHIRLQDIRLSYDFKGENLPFRQLQVYLYASNIGLLWSANEKGIDPDFNNAHMGVASYPTPFTTSIGVRANF